MKRFALALLPLLALSSPAFALVGGPFDQNTFGGPSNPSSGTYQGTLSGEDVSGVMLFGTSSTSAGSNQVTSTSNFNFFTGQSTNSSTQEVATGLQTTGNEGRVAIFDSKEGVLVIGEMSAVIDIAGRNISGVLEGSRLRSQQSIVNNTTNLELTGTNANSISTNSQTFTFNDVVNISGNFNAQITTLFPQLAFDGNGSLSITAPPPPDGSQGPQVVQREIGASDIISGTSAEQVTSTTEIVPILNTRQVDIQVSGVRTANAAPTFSGAIQTQESSVTQSTSTVNF